MGCYGTKKALEKNVKVWYNYTRTRFVELSMNLFTFTIISFESIMFIKLTGVNDLGALSTVSMSKQNVSRLRYGKNI